MSEPTPEEDLFTAALALAGPARIAFLDRVCAGQPALRASLESLLASSARADGFLEGSPPPPGFVPGETVGTRIDRYKLLEKLGEGGCGVVYLAEQELPVRRQVALKVIKLGMDTAAVIARFEAERQALALMDHPNIARVFDAGATTTGRPYFVMELVHGTRITDYCNQHRLPTADRLALFTHVCQAIQHAHQKGVIHRDIKPSNILVTLHDGVPVPKVIDFGIAKATHGRLTNHTLFTAFEQFVGTPAYMSPEQADISGVDVDTRSDIYSLGVLLYELLSGTPPFDPVTLRQAGLDEVRRIIREVEPPRPSTRLATLADQDRATVAQQRDIAPAQLTGLLRGDLDWIVMRCLEKNRARRYETPSALAADIARHLENEPVHARPPSRFDRTRKLLARHKVAFATAAIVAVLLIAGSILSTWQYFRERAALTRAVAAERTQLQLRLAAETNLARATTAEQTQARLAQQAERARAAEAGLRTEADAARVNEARMRRAAEEGQSRAQTEAIRSEQVARLMSEMLRGVGPRVALGRDTKLLRDILDDTAKRIGPDLAGQPEVEADLSATLAQAYSDLGDLPRAIVLRRRVLALRQEIDPGDAVAVALALAELGRTLLAQGNAVEAEAALRSALPLQEKVGDGRARHTRAQLASALERQGRYAEAEALHRGIVAANVEEFGADGGSIAGSMANLGSHLLRQGRRTEAIETLRESLATLRAQPDRDLAVAGVLNNLAFALRDLGQLAEAEASLRESIALRRKALGPAHPDIGAGLANLASLLRRRQQPEEAEALYRESLALQRQAFGADHPQLATTQNSLAHLLQERGQLDEARSLFESSVSVQRRLGLSSALSGTLLFLAQLEEVRRDPAAAERHFREAIALLRQTPDEWHERRSAVLLGLGRTLRAQGRAADAAVFEREGDAIRTQLRLAAVNSPASSPAIPNPSATAPASGSALSSSSDVGPIPLAADGRSTTSSTPPVPANAAATTTAARRRGSDTLRVLSFSPTNAPAGTSVKVTVRVAYRLASFSLGRVTLGFNTMGPTKYPVFDTKIIEGGEGELEFSATVTPVTHPNGARFSLLVTLAPEPRAPGSASLFSESRAFDPL